MKETFHLDAIDRKILAALQSDATISHANLAERVGASTASCWRRIAKLQAAGVLLGAVRLVDPGKVGKGVSVLCHVRMRSHAREERDAFEDFVRARAEIMDAYSMSGDWDYLLRVVVEDVAAYDRFLRGNLLGHPSVATASSHFALDQVKHSTALPLD